MSNLIWNEKIIESVKNALGEEESLSNTLMDTLLIGRESVYRRIRGDVPFTFEEVVKIAEKFDFSIDTLAGMNNKDKALFELNMLSPESSLEAYIADLQNYLRLLKEMGKCSSSVARYAINTLPYTLYLSYPNLARFKYFRCMYQASSMHRQPVKYAEVQIPPELEETQKMFVASSKYVNRTLMILDRNIFSGIRFDIDYFYKLHMLSEEDVALIRGELLDMVDTMEKVAMAGCYNTGKEVQMYLANIDLEASYAMLEYEKGGCAHLRLYGVSGVESRSQHMLNTQREWINSLRRYSTLISQSGEMIRHEYFMAQRKIIEQMGQ